MTRERVLVLNVRCGYMDLLFMVVYGVLYEGRKVVGHLRCF